MKAFFETVWYFIQKFWIPAVLVGIGVVQMFIDKWWILGILVLVAAVVALVDYLKK